MAADFGNVACELEDSIRTDLAKTVSYQGVTEDSRLSSLAAGLP